MAALLYIGYFALGVFQIAAIMSGFEIWLGVGTIIAFLFALLIGYIPFVGTAVGMYGAATAWHWSWMQAGLLFFGPFLALLILAFLVKRN
jgi:hypothetical protein